MYTNNLLEKRNKNTTTTKIARKLYEFASSNHALKFPKE